MNPITVLAALVASTVALAPAALDVGECERDPIAVTAWYDTEPIGSPFVETPPPTDWRLTVVLDCFVNDNDTAKVTDDVYQAITWEITPDSPPELLDTLREVLAVAEPDDGRIDIDG